MKVKDNNINWISDEEVNRLLTQIEELYYYDSCKNYSLCVDIQEEINNLVGRIKYLENFLNSNSEGEKYEKR